jgi:hypothetical protein
LGVPVVSAQLIQFDSGLPPLWLGNWIDLSPDSICVCKTNSDDFFERWDSSPTLCAALQSWQL